jgi:hypothetical protein
VSARAPRDAARSRRAGAALVALLLSACATNYALVEPGRHRVAGALTVAPSLAWNRVEAPRWGGPVEVWTQDGEALDRLVFVAGVADGETLLPPAGGGRDTTGWHPAPFHREMTGIEVAELFRATLARVHRTPLVETTAVGPATLDGVAGFRFELRFVGRDEVERAGIGVGAIRDGRLYLLWLEGARLDDYARWLPEFERIVASARLGAIAR